MDLKTNDTNGCDEALSSCKKQRIEEKVDRISNLHDTIIHHIFSFLSTVEVVRSSVLAKRWRYLWTTTPVLDFDDSHSQFVGTTCEFHNFVTFVHAFYKAASIQGYRLSVQQPKNVAHVGTWVRFAGLMNVKELNIINIGCRSFKMPCCESVSNLRLCLGDGILKMPATGCFSSLENLSLSRIDLGKSPIFEVVSHQYPRLRSLSLKDCDRMIHLKVDCPLLEELEVERCFGLNRLTVFAEKLNALSVHDSFTYGRASVKILAPRLQTFKWLDYIVGDFNIENFTFLRDAHVSLVLHFDPEKTESYIKNAKSFLSRLACAKTLQIEMPYFWGLSIQNRLLEGLSTPPHNLKHLSILVGENDYAFPALSHLFKCCPNLNALSIHIVDVEDRGEILEKYPEASLLDGGKEWRYEHRPLEKLFEAQLCGFSGCRHEIKFVEFLLKNAVVLKRMIILFATVDLDQSTKEQIAESIMGLEKTSPDVVFTFG